jgi:hypothetical protein
MHLERNTEGSDGGEGADMEGIGGRGGETEQPRLRRAADRDGLATRCHPRPTFGLVTKKKRGRRAGFGLGML